MKTKSFKPTLPTPGAVEVKPGLWITVWQIITVEYKFFEKFENNRGFFTSIVYADYIHPQGCTMITVYDPEAKIYHKILTLLGVPQTEISKSIATVSFETERKQLSLL